MKLHHTFLLGVVACSSVAVALVACSASTTIVTQNQTDSGASQSNADGGTNADSSTATDSGANVDAGEAQLPGNVTTPTSCSAVCSAAGRTCDPTYNWETDLNDSPDGTAGGDAEYQSSDGTYAFYALDCATAPPLTKPFDGTRVGDLKNYDCACK